MSIGDTLTAIANVNPSSIFSGSLPNPPGPLGGVRYEVVPLANQLGIGPQIERAFLNAKNNFLPDWLKLSFPLDNSPKPLGSITPSIKNSTYGGRNTVQSIQSRALSYARPTRYKVELHIPAAVPRGDWHDFSIMESCSATMLPGKSVATMDKRQASPNIMKLPYDVIYDDVKLTFQVTDQMAEHNAMQAWLDYIYNANTNSFAFPKSYYSDISIIQLDTAMEKIKTVKLIEAYPVAMSEIGLSYDASNTISTFDVNFAYRSWQTV